MKLKYKIGVTQFLAIGMLSMTGMTSQLYAADDPKEEPKFEVVEKNAQEKKASDYKHPKRITPGKKPKEVQPTPARPRIPRKKTREAAKPAVPNEKIVEQARDAKLRPENMKDLQVLKKRYERMAGHAPNLRKDMPLEEFLKIEKDYQNRYKLLRLRKIAGYSTRRISKACWNGNFESPLNGTWDAAYGRINSNGALILPLSAGASPGVLHTYTAHHTILPSSAEPAATDPLCGISVRHGGQKALRLGNAKPNYGAELVSKTFVVTNNEMDLKFWYACVFQNPHNHALAVQPGFEVRVLDASGNPIPGLVDLGGGFTKLKADQTNPFFQKKMYRGEALVYRDWSCARINLTRQLGKKVTVQFINVDCGYGGHFGYTYIDDFCGNCKGDKTGTIDIVSEKTECPTATKGGYVTIKYTVPLAGKISGTGQFTFSILQNGVVISAATQQTGIFSRNGYFTFKLPPCEKLKGMKGYDPTKGFDYFIEGNFIINGYVLPVKTAGTSIDGVKPGLNNDCVCPPDKPIGDPVAACCPDFKCLTMDWDHNGNSRYNISFNPNTVNACLAQMNAYVAYLKTLDSNITGFALNWTLHQGQASFPYVASSNPVQGPKLGFINGINVTGSPITFTNLQKGITYRLKLKVTLVTKDGSAANVILPKCPFEVKSDYFWNQTKSAIRPGAGQGSGLTIDGNPARAMKRRSNR